MKYCPNSTFIYPVSEEELIGLTKSLKWNSTARDDDIPENLLKQCIQLTKGPLAHIYNLSLKSAVFPDIRKTAKVRPVYKKGNTYDVRNYRPTSIIPVFAKVFERLMYTRIISFLCDKKSFRKLKMVLGRVNLLIKLFSHLSKGFRGP